jgi:alanyl-tRNA synthetase
VRQAAWAKKGGFLCATSEVPSHEAHVAEVLVYAGADAAFAGTANEKGNARISARLRPALSESIDLPKLMEEVGKKIGGGGGGHPAAAGANGPDGGEVPKALLLCQRLFFSRIGKE